MFLDFLMVIFVWMNSFFCFSEIVEFNMGEFIVLGWKCFLNRL